MGKERRERKMDKKIFFILIGTISILFGFDKTAHIEACKNNDVAACYALALQLTTGKNIENQESMKEGTSYMRKSCVYGEAKACDKLGENYLKDKSYGAARPYLTDSCNRGIKTACESVGTIYRDGHDVRQNDTKAREFYVKACDLKSPDACHNVAIMYRGGFGVVKDRVMEKSFYQKGCDLGLKVSCDQYTILDNEDKGIKTGLWESIKSWF